MRIGALPGDKVLAIIIARRSPGFPAITWTTSAATSAAVRSSCSGRNTWLSNSFRMVEGTSTIAFGSSFTSETTSGNAISGMTVVHAGGRSRELVSL